MIQCFNNFCLPRMALQRLGRTIILPRVAIPRWGRTIILPRVAIPLLGRPVFMKRATLSILRSTMVLRCPCSLSRLFPCQSLRRIVPKLRRVHQNNDRAVKEGYPFDGRTMIESECVTELFKRYQALIECPTHRSLSERQKA